MIRTLTRRITVRTLDSLVERGQRSRRKPIQLVAYTLDKAREIAGLSDIEARSPKHMWSRTVEEVPMWRTDRNKLHKHQVDKGIVPADDGSAPATSSVGEPTADAAAPQDSAKEQSEEDGPAVKVYFSRGCPHARGAVDLLREREIEFEQIDVTMDESTRGWLKIVTKQSTVPQIFIGGKTIGGFSELRELDHEGELRPMVADASKPAKSEESPKPGVVGKRADGSISLNVVRPIQSPFEMLDLESSNVDADMKLEGDELIDAVKGVLDECRPMIQADGGDIMLLDVSQSSVSVELTGNCIGCPSAQATLKQGIERRMRAKIPQIEEVRSPQLS